MLSCVLLSAETWLASKAPIWAVLSTFRSAVCITAMSATSMART